MSESDTQVHQSAEEEFIQEDNQEIIGKDGSLNEEQVESKDVNSRNEEDAPQVHGDEPFDEEGGIELDEDDEQNHNLEQNASGVNLPSLMQFLQGQHHFNFNSPQQIAALQALVLGNQAAAHQAPAAGEEPYFVNVKQYYRILRRREARARWFARFAEKRNEKGYIHESRHRHAVKRPRDSHGRFLRQPSESSETPK